MSGRRHRRAARRVTSTAGLLGVLALAACNALTNTDGLQFVLEPDGPEVCSDPAKDCPPPASACQIAVCEANKCGVKNVDAGPVGEQVKGDCQAVVCDGNGGMPTIPDDADVADDGKECTVDACESGLLTHTPIAAKTSCSQGNGSVCDATGTCVECVDDGDCDMPDTCAGGNVCACAEPCPLWNKSFADGRGLGVTGDGNHDVIVAGYFSGSASFGGGPLMSAGESDIFVAKLDAAGNHEWSQRFGDAASQRATHVAANGQNQLFLAGDFFGTVNFGGALLTSAGNDDLFVAKFDEAGSHLWSKSFGGGLADQATGMAVDGAGYVILAGFFSDTIDFGGGMLTAACAGFGGDLFVVKLDPQGTHQWTKAFCKSGLPRIAGVATDSQGNILLTGYFDGSTSFGGNNLSGDTIDVFVAKLKPNGDHIWSKDFGDSKKQFASGIAIDKNDDVLVTGAFEGTIDFGGGPLSNSSPDKFDVFVAKLGSADGSPMWSKRFGEAGDQFGSTIAVDSGGDPIIAGSFQGDIDFGGGKLASPGTQRIYVAKLAGGDGGHGYSKSVQGSGSQTGVVIAADSSDDVLMTGVFDGEVDFGLGALANKDPSIADMFLVRFKP